MKRIYFLLILFMYAVLFLWGSFAVARTGYSMIVLAKDIRQWFFGDSYTNSLSLYGDVYIVFRQLQQIDPHSQSFLLIAKDGKPYYYGRYVLFPKKIYWVTGIKQIDLFHSHHTIILYHPQDFVNPPVTLIKNWGKNVIFDSNRMIIAVIYKYL